jgi:hypothetical protein
VSVLELRKNHQFTFHLGYLYAHRLLIWSRFEAHPTIISVVICSARVSFLVSLVRSTSNTPECGRRRERILVAGPIIHVAYQGAESKLSQVRPGAREVRV